jgi:hypothetical protein
MDVKEIKVTKPEDWAVATEVRQDFTLDTLSAAGSLTFKLRAMSGAELRELEEQIPLPEAPVVKVHSGLDDRDFNDSDYQERLAVAHFSRWVMWIDKCWKTLPGNTQSEKVQWAEANLWRNGEITALFNALRRLSGLNTGKPAVSASVAVVEADPEMWAKASQAARIAYQIPHGESVLVFDLAGISQLKVNQIREMCRPPAPPMRPEIHRMNRKPIPGTEKPDYTDPDYQQAVKESGIYENCMLLEAALFPFPGATKEEKRKWLDERPAYEVSALLKHLVDNVISYRDRTNFI